MYSILIVDDERNIREGISRNIQWETLGFKLVGSCENGIEALDYVEKYQPDVVLTDICMPFMDGIALSENIMAMKPDTKVIVLTGHDKFEYVQKAIKLKISDFILKPIMPKELVELLKKIKEELDEEKQQIESVQLLKQQLLESLPLRRERFLNRWIRNTLSSEEILQKLKTLEIKLNVEKSFSVVAVVEIKKCELDKMTFDMREIVYRGALNACTSTAVKIDQSVVFENYNERIVMIFSDENVERLIETVDLAALKVVETVRRHLKTEVVIGIGNIVDKCDGIKASYRSAKDAMDYHMINNNSVIKIDDMVMKSEKKISKIGSSKLTKMIRSGNIKELNRATDIFFDEVKKSCSDIRELYVYVQNNITSILILLEEQDINYSDIIKSDRNPLLEVYEFNSLDDLQEWYKALILKVVGYIRSYHSNFQKKQALIAKDIINEQYSDPTLSLKKICGELHISSSYFSSLFKDAFNMTFIECLTSVRVEKAKELMINSEMRSYEIAELVGYNDPHYFSVIFKKNVGQSPTEFRSKKGVSQ